MIDFHSHILPDIDDGAKDVETSLEMLKNAYNDGITTVVSTSHIYMGEESDIDRFIEKRDRAYDTLCEAMSADGGQFPEIRLGAEVYTRPYIGRYESITRLAISGTDYILLEMPINNAVWTQEHYEAIYNITTLGLKPIMAHIDRYLDHKNDFHNLKALDAVFQVNAEAFLHKKVRKEMLSLYYDGYLHLLGSDMHNLQTRPNRLKEAYEVILEKLGREFWDYPMQNAKTALENGTLQKNTYPKLGFFDKLKL